MKNFFINLLLLFQLLFQLLNWEKAGARPLCYTWGISQKGSNGLALKDGFYIIVHVVFESYNAALII